MQTEVLAISTAGTDAEVAMVRGKVVRSRWARNLLTFLMVFGPGLIVMEADNDAGAVSTYTQAGAQYGTRLLWLILLLLPVTYFIQEMVVRLGIATGKGHAAMIYQRFGKWWGVFSLVDLELVNFLTLVTEFAAIALAVEHLGTSPNLGVPIAAAGLMAMVITGSYLRWERTVVLLCLLDLAWLWIAFQLQPGKGEILHNTLVPGIPKGGLTGNLMFLVIAIVGTTIAPWQLIILGVQVLAGIMLPSAIIFLQLLLNDKELLGDYVNKRWNNIVNWTIIIVLFALSLILAAQVVAPNLFPQG